MKLLKATYALDDRTTRVLIGSRLRGKALDWLHSKAEFLEITVEQLLYEMKGMFRHRVSKIALRKEFENRTWKHGESFSEYLHDKVILANKIPVDEEEVVEYIVKGIPDPVLKDQARVQQLKTKSSLLEAFEKVMLRQKGQSTGFNGKKSINKPVVKGSKASSSDEKKPGKENVRCYNCNVQGHLAKQCSQAKKESPTCFNCDAVGHLARNCKAASIQKSEEDKEQVSNVAVAVPGEDNSTRDVRYELISDSGCVSLHLHTLIDTGSAISFIKVKLILPNVIYKSENPSEFCGINNSKLSILGAANARICLDGVVKENITLLVVLNDTMKPPVILGRDVLREFGYTLQRDLDKKEAQIAEILNIEIAEGEAQQANMLDVNPELPICVREEVGKLYEEEYVQPERPEKPKVDAELKLVLKEHSPFSTVPRRLSYTEKEVMRKLLVELIDKNITRASQSEYSSPVVLVKKKTGEYRMCIDYRVLNKYLLRDHYSMPLIEDQLDVLAGKKYFTLLDLKDGFYHVKIAEDSIRYMSFVTPLGQYEYLKVPFGLKIAPLRFQRFVNEVLRVFIDSGDLVAYMDDFMVATSTIEHHVCVLRKVFRALVDNLLVLRTDKCKFLYTTVEYLGYVISENDVSPTKSCR